MSPTQLAKSRTAWTVLLTIGVSWAGRKLGLSEAEQSAAISALQVLVVGWYLDDKTRGRR